MAYHLRYEQSLPLVQNINILKKGKKMDPITVPSIVDFSGVGTALSTMLADPITSAVTIGLGIFAVTLIYRVFKKFVK